MTTLENIIIKQFNEDLYKLFYIPAEYLNDLYDAEPVFNYNSVIKNRNQIENIFKTKKYCQFNEFIAVRKSGKMFTYEKEIVPIHFYSIYRGEINKLYFRFIAYTIDDSCSSFWKQCKDYDELIKYYKSAFQFLYEYTEMPDSKGFEDFWDKHGVEEYDYN